MLTGVLSRRPHTATLRHLKQASKHTKQKQREVQVEIDKPNIPVRGLNPPSYYLIDKQTKSERGHRRPGKHCGPT